MKKWGLVLSLIALAVAVSFDASFAASGTDVFWPDPL